MAYNEKKTYFLCYKNEKLAKLTGIHNSMGWLTGGFEPLPAYINFRDFLLEYSQLEDDWGDPEFWDPSMEKLKSKFGKDLIGNANWSKVDSETDKQVEIMIPFVDESSKRLTWRE